MISPPVWSAAEDPIWALVCGLPSPKRERRRILTLQAYIDDSREGDTFVLAGYIAAAEEWAAFSIDWQELLDMQPHLAYFKMNEMAQSPERIERASWFYRVIERHVQVAISCTIPIDELLRAVRTFDWPPNFTNLHRLENPYHIAFKAIINMTAQHQQKMGFDEPIDFIFDDQSEKRVIRNIWDRYKLSVSPEVRRLTGEEPIFRDDKQFLPLQSADLWAWWVRRWAVNGIDDGIKNLPFGWEAKRDIRRMAMEFNEEDFKIEFAKSRDPKALSQYWMDDDAVVAALEALEASEEQSP